MGKKCSKLFFYFMAALFLITFTIQQVGAQSGDDGKITRKTGQYISKVDNFLVLLDASESMTESYKGVVKFTLAKNFVSRMNQSLPDFKVNSALRTFGLTKAFSFASTSIVSPLAPYSKKTFEEALQSVTKAAGQSPMAEGINASSDDLKAAQGKIAVIIVSDWDELGNAPVAAAAQMKSQYGDRICIYPVMVGKDTEGLKLMDKVATAGQCGFTTQAEQVASDEDMDQFVEKVFFSKYVIPDSDNDGVLDNIDKCPGTPAGVAVDKDGCPLDSDKDGVLDYLDKCPDTPEGVKVDKDGCPLDSDKDGVYDYLDKCPGTPEGVKVDKDGCPLDSDKDGVYDYLDKCPGTPEGVKVDKDGCPLDSDKDGVYDYLDKCPNTPEGVKVEKDGCPPPPPAPAPVLDSDNDGVLDNLDKCPGTPAGVKVDSDGCPIQVSKTIKIEFDTAKSVVKSKYHNEVKEIADLMKKNPQVNVVIEGHTDNVGREEANVHLSQERANSVRAYLIEKFGIEKERLQAVGYGPQKPIADNATAEGKQKNRRVQAVINTVINK
jgi:outer membrane protein OmpA-like peptidoglycan-associated protein